MNQDLYQIAPLEWERQAQEDWLTRITKINKIAHALAKYHGYKFPNDFDFTTTKNPRETYFLGMAGAALEASFD